MDYKAVTDTSSTQYKYLSQSWTRADGMQMYGDRELWALGYKYGSVGDKLNIHLSSGEVIKAIKGDSKAVDCAHPDGSSLEAIVNSDVVYDLGRWTSNEGLNVDYEGYIVKVDVINE